MEKISLNASVRDLTGKAAAKRFRAEGLVPAVLCQAGSDSTSLLVDEKELRKALHTKAGENVILELRIKDKSKKQKEVTVIIKEVQHNPIKDNLTHVDFNEISLTEKLEVKIPIAVKGETEAKGVKVDEGVLERILWELDIECLPMNIPEQVEVDVTELGINEAIHVKDLKVPSDVTVLNDPEAVVVAIKPPHVEPEVKEEEEEITEPELIREKKEGEEEGEEGEEAKEEPKQEKPQKPQEGKEDAK
jgi:large subunit ribosomal protein L25